jgi:hypothetical protein
MMIIKNKVSEMLKMCVYIVFWSDDDRMMIGQNYHAHFSAMKTKKIADLRYINPRNKMLVAKID